MILAGTGHDGNKEELWPPLRPRGVRHMTRGARGPAAERSRPGSARQPRWKGARSGRPVPSRLLAERSDGLVQNLGRCSRQRICLTAADSSVDSTAVGSNARTRPRSPGRVPAPRDLAGLLFAPKNCLHFAPRCPTIWGATKALTGDKQVVAGNGRFGRFGLNGGLGEQPKPPQPPPIPPPVQESEPAAVAAVQVETVAAPVETSPIFDVPRTSSYHRRRTTGIPPMVQLVGQLAGAVLGLAIAYYVLLLINPRYDVFGITIAGRKAQEQEARPPQPQQKPAQQQPRPQPRPRQEQPQAREPGRLPQPRPRQQFAPDDEPLAVPAQPAKPPPAFNVAPHFDLPARAQPSNVPIAEIAVPDLVIDVRASEQNLLQFILGVEDGEGGKVWTIFDADTKQPIALLKWNGIKVEFSWHPDAPPAADSLRNALLVFRAGDYEQMMALRQPVEVPAWHVMLNKETLRIPVDAPLYGLPFKSLNLALTWIGELEPKKVDPKDHRAAMGKKVRLIFSDKPPVGEIQAGLLTLSGKPSLDIKPIMRDGDGKERPWTVDKVNGAIKSTQKKIADAEAAPSVLGNEIQAHQTQISQLRPALSNVSTRAAAAAEIDLLNVTIARKQEQIANAQAALPILKQQLAVLMALAELGAKVHDKADLQYRAFYVVGEQEIDVLRTKAVQ